MSTLCDAHCHLDFYQHVELVAAHLMHDGHVLLNASVTPDKAIKMATLAHAQGFDQDQESSHTGKLLVGLGLHPWCVNGGEVSLSLQKCFFELIDQFDVLGEIGLDFSARYKPHALTQVSFFEAICQHLSANRSYEAATTSTPSAILSAPQQKILSIHAVKSTDTILDLLKSYRVCENHRVIFHWFSGSHTELLEAQRLGCLFSVNRTMLETKRGRAYVAGIPTSSLLVETDAPARAWDTSDAHDAYQAHAKQLTDTYELLAQLKGETVETLAEKLYQLV